MRKDPRPKLKPEYIGSNKKDLITPFTLGLILWAIAGWALFFMSVYGT